MKWYGWSILSLVVLAGTMSAVALEPLSSRETATSSRRGYIRPATLTQAEAAPPAPAERIGSDTPVHYRQATWNIWGGYHGYVYTPDACDYTPPCVDHLWDGYQQYFHRCEGFHWGWGRGCHSCGRGHCGHCRRHRGCGDKIGCDSCVAKAPACGIEKAPVCGIEKAPACGVEPSCGCHGHRWHWGHHWNGLCHKSRHFWHRTRAHWSCSCGTDIGCGCGVDAKGGYPQPSIDAPGEDQPPAPIPTAEETQASHKVEVKEVRAIKLPAIGTGLRSALKR